MTTTDELDQLLDRIDAEARAEEWPGPVLALVGLGDSRYLAVGLGADEVIVNMNDMRDWTNWMSLGDLYQDDDDVDFWSGNQPSYFSRRELVPIATARQAVRMLYETGELPAVIRWYQP